MGGYGLDYEKKIKSQDAYIDKLLKKIELLETENSNLRKANEFINQYNTASGDKAKEMIISLSALIDKYKSDLSEVEIIKDNYKDLVRQANKFKKQYQKEMSRFLKTIHNGKTIGD